MALSATLYHWTILVSDVDRGVYRTLDLRIARHPSESLRYLLLRVLAYVLSYEEGIGFSRGGLSATDEAPVSIRDATGALTAWIDVGSPSAERLHKAAKRAARVAVFTSGDADALQREIAAREVFRAEEIEIWCVPVSFLASLEAVLDRKTEMEIVRNEGELYVTAGIHRAQGTLVRHSAGESLQRAGRNFP